MPRLRIDPRNHRRLAVFAFIIPLLLIFLYWFVRVGFSDPASRLSDDLQSHARRALISRVPLTFTHQPIDQWTRPMKDFYIRLQRNGDIRISNGGQTEGRYRAEIRDPAAIAGNFQYRNIGSAVEIELIPIGDRAEVASVRPID